MSTQIFSPSPSRAYIGHAFAGVGRYSFAASFRRSLGGPSRLVLVAPGVIALVWRFESPLIFGLVVPGAGFQCFLVP